MGAVKDVKAAVRRCGGVVDEVGYVTLGRDTTAHVYVSAISAVEAEGVAGEHGVSVDEWGGGYVFEVAR
jgi:hypothetical protein